MSEKWPFWSNSSPACHSKHNPIGGFPHVYCAVNNRSRDNGSASFSPRAHHPSGCASFEADARRQAASLAAIQAETSSASLMASPSHALLNLSAPAVLPSATAGHYSGTCRTNFDANENQQNEAISIWYMAVGPGFKPGLTESESLLGH